MRVIVTGGTGTAGSEVIRQALKDPSITRVTALARRALPIEHEKLTVVLHEDYENYARVEPQLRDHDACLWCLGISASGLTEDEYRKITVDYTLAGARAFAALNPDIAFCFLSGGGTDSREKSRMMFARVKGRAENELGRLGLKGVHHFRPAYIRPVDPSTKKKLADRLMGPFATVGGLFSDSATITTVQLARAMLHVAAHGADKLILENRDLLAIARSLGA